MGEHIVGVVKMPVPNSHVVGCPQAKAAPGSSSNHVDYSMEDLRPVGRTAVGDQIVNEIEGQAGGDGGQDGKHSAVTVAEPERAQDHGKHQGQHRPTALAKHDEHAQASQRHQPHQLQATLLRRLVNQEKHCRTDDIGTENRVRYFADALQADQPRLALQAVEMNDRDQRRHRQQGTTDHQ
ncbi:hypothetical protein D3C75_550310 [compost metagenome]